MKKIYNSTIGRIMADKRRQRMAMAIFAPLCLAVAVLTLVMSALPAATASGPALITISGQKTVTGANAPNKTFTFTLTQLNSANLNDPMSSSVHNRTVNVPTTGANTYNYSFTQHSFAAAGTYYFKLEESPASGSGWNNDTVPRLLVINVTGDPLTATVYNPGSLIHGVSSEFAATPAMMAYSFKPYASTSYYFQRRLQFSNATRLTYGCWPMTTNNAAGWSNPSIYTVYNPIFRIELCNSAGTTQQREWVFLCGEENKAGPASRPDPHSWQASRDGMASALGFTLASSDFGRLDFAQFMRFLALDNTGIANANKPSNTYSYNGVALRDLERLCLMHDVVWYFEYKYLYPALPVPPTVANVNASTAFPNNLVTISPTPELGAIVRGTTNARSHYSIIRNYIGSANYSYYPSQTNFAESFVQTIKMLNEMVVQHNAGKTTALTMNYTPSSGVLKFDHDGFVPYYPTNTAANQSYYTTLTWPTTTGLTVRVNNATVSSGVRVYKTDNITVTHSGTAPVKLTLTDTQRYVKADTIKGDLIRNTATTTPAGSTLQKLVTGYAEFINLQSELTIVPGATNNTNFGNSYSSTPISTQFKATKTVGGTNVPSAWGPFSFAVYVSDQYGSQGSQEGTTKYAYNYADVVTFDSISFTTAGPRYYLIKETSMNSSTWDVSQKEYLVYVMVSDNGLGALTVSQRQISSRENGGSWSGWTDYTDSNVTFNNTYKQPTGSLLISKVMADSSDNSFFSFTLRDSSNAVVNYTTGGRSIAKVGGSGSLNTSSSAQGRFMMTRDTTVEISGLVPDSYTITEDATGYSITYTVNGGSASTPVNDSATTGNLGVTAGGTTAVEFTNTQLPGTLRLKKVVSDTSDGTAFTYTLRDSSNAVVNYTAGGRSIVKVGGSGILDPTNPSSGQFTVTGDTTVEIRGLAMGFYTVTEDATGYRITYRIDGGSPSAPADDLQTANVAIMMGEVLEVEFTNTKIPCKLRVSKVVADTSDNTAFTYTLTDSIGNAVDYTTGGRSITKISGTGNLMQTVPAQGKFTLTRDTLIEISGLKSGTDYYVTEDATGYRITYRLNNGTASGVLLDSSTANTGTVSPGNTATIEFTNVKYASLEISKVLADGGDSTAFTYTITDSTGTAVNYTADGRSISKTGGSGTLTQTVPTQGKFTITRDTTVLIKGLTPGTYTVTEDATGYTVTYKVNGGGASSPEADGATANTGSIAGGSTATVEFTNVKYASLEISKVLADTSDNTAFTYTLRDSGNAAVNYTTGGRSISKTGGTGTLTQTVPAQGKFTMTRDTTVLIKGLTPGTYTVTEDATGYTVTYKVNGGGASSPEADGATANTGSIAGGSTATVEFTNEADTGGPIIPETGGIGRRTVTAIGTGIVLTVSMFCGGTLIYRQRRRRSYLK